MLIRIVCLTIALLGYSNVFAEQVRIPIGQQSDASGVNKPAHGSTKADVERQFGSPESRRGPVGNPPIYFWEYASFTVYFESNRVIHSVSKIKSRTAVRK